MQSNHKYVSLILLSTLTACGGSGGNEPNITVEATSTSIQANIFNLSCALSGCHAGPSPEESLSLEEGVSFTNLINVISAQDASFLRVNPGDADNSYLIQKLEGTASTGARMPLNRSALPQQNIDAVRTWINNGAIVN